MIKLENLDLVLEIGFKDFVIKNKRGKQYFGIRKMGAFIPKNDKIEKFYHSLLNYGKTKSYSIVAALLLKQRAEGIKLKEKYISTMLSEGNIRVDLTAPEVEENQEEMISLMVNNYKNERELFLDLNGKKENLGIIFTESASLSTYKQLNAKAVKFQLMSSEKQKHFGINEEEFFKKTIRTIFNTYNDEIDFQCYDSTEGSMNEYALNVPYSIVSVTVGKKNIVLENMDRKYNTILEQEVNRHNTRIDMEETKELKKER